MTAGSNSSPLPVSAGGLAPGGGEADFWAGALALLALTCAAVAALVHLCLGVLL